jgi:hypothetical protein
MLTVRLFAALNGIRRAFADLVLFMAVIGVYGLLTSDAVAQFLFFHVVTAPRRSASGGRTWWAHIEFTRINIAPTILRKKIEDLHDARGRDQFQTPVPSRVAARRAVSSLVGAPPSAARSPLAAPESSLRPWRRSSTVRLRPTARPDRMERYRRASISRTAVKFETPD